MSLDYIVTVIERWVFRHRVLLLLGFMAVTAFMLMAALRTRIDAGFTKQIPIHHEYIQTFLKYQDQFGGANRIIIALTVPEDEDIFSQEYFSLLKKVTDEIFYIDGVDRSLVTSLWTPNVRYVEIVEDGFTGGNVIPATFTGSEEDLKTVRENIIKSGKLGQLVATDFTGAIVSAQLQDINPRTGEKLDYIRVAKDLEDKIRLKYEKEGKSIGLKIHVIGFAKVIGDVSDGAKNVIFFFIVSFFVTGLFVHFYALSWRLTILPLITSLVAVVWQMGLLNTLGYGIDPMSILVPFLVFAIGVSHGVQMVRSFRTEYFRDFKCFEASRSAFRQLLIPGGTALLTDTIGFITILLIKIEIIQELAITASLGVMTIIFTNLFLLPILLSYVRLKPGLKEKVEERSKRTDLMWRKIARVSQATPSLITILVAIVIGILALGKARKVKIGDIDHGVPELRASSRYNVDSAVITNKFNIGVDIVSVIAETFPDGCIDYDVVSLIDRFQWHMLNIEGVQSVIALPGLAKIINSGWYEGNPKWQILPRHPAAMAQAINPIDTSTGLINGDGSVMPILIFLKDHKAETIESVITEVKKFREDNASTEVRFQLASGNVGVMGATNEVVSAAQFPMLIYVFSAVIVLCLLAFRSWRAAFCIVVPLALVSILAYSLMYFLGIGLKVSTLPVVALGVGVGVDYGIYLFSRLQVFLKNPDVYFEEALIETFRMTGSAVVFTGLTLAVGVSTWIFSELKFQADMGIMLTFMFLLNMLGAILLLPAIARWLFRHHQIKTE